MMCRLAWLKGFAADLRRRPADPCAKYPVIRVTTLKNTEKMGKTNLMSLQAIERYIKGGQHPMYVNHCSRTYLLKLGSTLPNRRGYGNGIRSMFGENCMV